MKHFAARRRGRPFDLLRKTAILKCILATHNNILPGLSPGNRFGQR
jgi:hypothetical protein